MPPAYRSLVVRLTVSVGFIGVLVGVAQRLRHVNDATIALLLILFVVGIATLWGSLEALAAAIVGGIGFDYYFLPPHGFGIEAPEHWVALIAFSITAVVTGQLAAQSRRRRILAERQQQDMEKLYQLVNAMLESGGVETTLARLADRVREIFGKEGVALCDGHSGQLFRSGKSEPIPDGALRKTAQDGIPLDGPGFSVSPIRHGGALAGSVGIAGPPLSAALLDAIAGTVGLGLAKLYAIERTTEAEVARRSEELKSAVLDSLAHELRNPLNSVKIAATTLLSDHADSGLYRNEMLTVIDEEVGRMDRFIDEAVQLARMEASELTPKKSPEDLVELIAAALKETGTLAANRPIHVSVPESIPWLDCDKTMILRVLNQLLNNALKYSPPDSPLAVSAEVEGPAIIVKVVDRGPGVAKDERERVFEKFYRGRAARGSVRGTGLGLPAAKCIVEAHGGRMWVTAADGGGAAFHISLPLASANHKAGAR